MGHAILLAVREPLDGFAERVDLGFFATEAREEGEWQRARVGDPPLAAIGRTDYLAAETAQFHDRRPVSHPILLGIATSIGRREFNGLKSIQGQRYPILLCNRAEGREREAGAGGGRSWGLV